MTRLRRGLLLIALLGGALSAVPAAAQESLQQLSARLGAADREARQDAIVALGMRSEPAALVVLEALAAGKLRVTASGQVLVVGSDRKLRDAISGKAATASGAVSEPMVNNTTRRAVELSISQLQLRSKDLEVRQAAAKIVAESPPAEMEEILREVLAGERDPAVRKLLRLSIAQLDLVSSDARRRVSGVKVFNRLLA